MNTLLLLISSYLVYFSCCLYSVNAVDYDGWLNLELQHSFNSGKDYSRRGSIAVKSLRTGAAVIDQQPLTRGQLEDLERLAKENGFYKVRTTATFADGKETEFFSSMKADVLLGCGLNDEINLWVMHTGAPISVSFNGVNSTEERKQSLEFESNLYLRHVDLAPVPDTASYIQKLERERDAREKGGEKDNRSFLAKYWMYIVPVAIFVLVSGTSAPEAGNQR